MLYDHIIFYLIFIKYILTISSMIGIHMKVSQRCNKSYNRTFGLRPTFRQAQMDNTKFSTISDILTVASFFQQFCPRPQF